MKERDIWSEALIQEIQKILSAEFNETPHNFRNVSEKIFDFLHPEGVASIS